MLVIAHIIYSFINAGLKVDLFYLNPIYYFYNYKNPLNKTLNINIHQDPTKHVEKFLQGWLQFGAYEQVTNLQYELFDNTGKTCVLSMNQDEITIHGNIPSKSFMLIDALSKACEGDRVIEGEVIDKNQTRQSHQQDQPNFEDLFGSQAGGANGAGFKMPMGMNSMIKISGMAKWKVVLLLILALPILIIMIPVMIIVAIFKVIMFKLNIK